jgi:hypothetical protein
LQQVVIAAVNETSQPKKIFSKGFQQPIDEDSQRSQQGTFWVFAEYTAAYIHTLRLASVVGK